MKSDMLYTEMLACIVLILTIALIIVIAKYLKKIKEMNEAIIEQHEAQIHLLSTLNDGINEIMYEVEAIKERIKWNG